jgi:RNA polymerase primary sigma factor
MKYKDSGDFEIIKNYISKISKIEILTKEEEKNLFEEFKNNNNLEARTLLILHNLKFAFKIAKEHKNDRLDFSDILSEANKGLIYAIENYNPSFGNSFLSYARFWIIQSINRALDNTSREIRIPSYLIHKRRTFEEFYDSLNMEDTLNKKKIFDEHFFNKNELNTLLDSYKKFVSLNASYEDGEERVSNLKDPKMNVFDEVFINLSSKRIREILQKNLSDIEYKVLCYRFGLNNDKNYSLKEIGFFFRLTGERIRQIEKKALEKLRNSEKLKDIYNSFYDY